MANPIKWLKLALSLHDLHKTSQNLECASHESREAWKLLWTIGGSIKTLKINKLLILISTLILTFSLNDPLNQSFMKLFTYTLRCVRSRYTLLLQTLHWCLDWKFAVKRSEQTCDPLHQNLNHPLVPGAEILLRDLFKQLLLCSFCARIVAILPPSVLNSVCFTVTSPVFLDTLPTSFAILVYFKFCSLFVRFYVTESSFLT